jgi:lysophospholipase L1-like esterase
MSGRRSRSARVSLLLASAGVAVALLAGAAAPAMAGTRADRQAGDHQQAWYYLALGDSLAQGVQPATPPLPPGVTAGQSIETSQGYVDDLFAHYSAGFHGRLRLVKLGCPGETTGSMLTGAGSPCTYPQGSQLAAALAFISAHRNAIALITIDIGANDVDGCAAGGVINQPCIASGFAAVQANLPKILGALRSAAREDTVMAGMNLYDPFLADYLTGPAGQAVAAQSVSLSVAFNTLLGAGFAAFHLPVADVQDSFSTTDLTDTATLPGIGAVPLDVARICTWTWMCAPSPYGPNIHANAAGYQQIAGAFEGVIRRLG